MNVHSFPKPHQHVCFLISPVYHSLLFPQSSLSSLAFFSLICFLNSVFSCNRLLLISFMVFCYTFPNSSPSLLFCITCLSIVPVSTIITQFIALFLCFLCFVSFPVRHKSSQCSAATPPLTFHHLCFPMSPVHQSFLFPHHQAVHRSFFLFSMFLFSSMHSPVINLLA